MDGSSLARDTEHGRAITAQMTRRHGTLEEAIEAGIFALSAAGLSKGIRRQARGACDDYFFNRLSLTPSHELGGPEELTEGLELMPDPMYRVLEGIVELVVDGDYEELRAASRNRLGVEDLRRRVEEDCPEALVLPPREIYRVEAITKSDDPDMPGWAYFLDLLRAAQLVTRRQAEPVVEVVLAGRARLSPDALGQPRGAQPEDPRLDRFLERSVATRQLRGDRATVLRVARQR